MPVLLKELMQQLGEHTALADMLKRALVAEPPLMARDGGFIASGYHAVLDHHRSLQRDAKQVIAQMQQRYAQESGINLLKIKFNNVLGYFIEITAAHESKVPEHFIHRQSLANNLRYTTTELADTARDIAEASGRAQQIELECFETLTEEIRKHADALVQAARALAQLDVLSSLAVLAQQQRYVRPQMEDSTAFEISGGRHPVVEASLRRDGASFIANQCNLSDAQSLWLLTGPNMAGKSTFLRQNALIAILAQAGSYVPADAARIGLVDRLFSRVGAADDLARGQSTFMVEMVETATILNQATARSLVILDEIGRGTATYDGLSIAWAVVEHLHNQIGCRALFATHYHELTQLSDTLKHLACHTMAVKEWKGQVVFLHEVKPGTADRSYGIHVAQLAGLPQPVTLRAKAVLAELESRAKAEPLPLFAQAVQREQVQMAEQPDALRDMLAEIKPDDLSPREALELLYQLKKEA
jgi:DNA mismatch repair protein MutS